MHFPNPHRKKEHGALPTVETPTKIPPPSKSMEEKRKDSATSSSPVSKPLPTRNPSTRFQTPTQTPTSMHRNASTKSSNHTRPGLQRRRTTARTRYIDMLLGLDAVPPFHNILASLSVWILLAGYIVFPATFSKLQTDEVDDKADSQIKKYALNTVRNVPLLYVAAFACGLGVAGCLWLWWRHRKNYVWVINRVFLPALLNSIAGLISTIVNIYSAQNGQYSVTAKVTVVVTAACSVVAAALFLLYNTVMLKVVKNRHEREVREWDEGDDIVLEREERMYTRRGV